METEKGPNEANDDDSGEFSTQKERILGAITEDSLFDLSCSSEEEDNLDPIHFLPIGSSTLKEYETAADSAKKRASSDGKRTSTKLKLSDVDPKELILRAAEKGRVDLVDYSLDKDISLLRSTDADGYTPLHRACYNGHEEVVRTLLRRGADVLARTSDGWQPLHNACRWGQLLVTWGEGWGQERGWGHPRSPRGRLWGSAVISRPPCDLALGLWGWGWVWGCSLWNRAWCVRLWKL